MGAVAGPFTSSPAACRDWPQGSPSPQERLTRAECGAGRGAGVAVGTRGRRSELGHRLRRRHGRGRWSRRLDRKLARRARTRQPWRARDGPAAAPERRPSVHPPRAGRYLRPADARRRGQLPAPAQPRRDRRRRRTHMGEHVQRSGDRHERGERCRVGRWRRRIGRRDQDIHLERAGERELARRRRDRRWRDRDRDCARRHACGRGFDLGLGGRIGHSRRRVDGRRRHGRERQAAGARPPARGRRARGRGDTSTGAGFAGAGSGGAGTSASSGTGSSDASSLGGESGSSSGGSSAGGSSAGGSGGPAAPAPRARPRSRPETRSRSPSSRLRSRRRPHRP